MNAISQPNTLSQPASTELKSSNDDGPLREHRSPAPTRPKISKKKLILGAALVALIAGGSWAGRWWWTIGRFQENTDNAYVAADISPISPQIDGFIAQVAVGDNQLVKTGDVLVRIDDPDFIARRDHVDAAVATAL
ncbi:MAG TPA: biotin/lipoyl-binding protein, partial [Dongiaceae bacterium]